jgi:hypothetical protein
MIIAVIWRNRQLCKRPRPLPRPSSFMFGVNVDSAQIRRLNLSATQTDTRWEL